MIPKKNRLTSLFFKNPFKKGKNVDSVSFSLKYNKENKENYGVSVVISKKVASKATERNLLKRRFLSVVFNNKNLLKQGYSYVFYLKKDIKNTIFSDLEKEIRFILLKNEENN